MKPVLPHAQLDWDDQGRPRSRVFDDVYFSDQSGLDETRFRAIADDAKQNCPVSKALSAVPISLETEFAS